MVIFEVVVAVALVGAGAYLESKFGSKIAARVASLESDVAGIKSKVSADVAAVKKAV